MNYLSAHSYCAKESAHCLWQRALFGLWKQHLFSISKDIMFPKINLKLQKRRQSAVAPNLVLRKQM